MPSHSPAAPADILDDLLSPPTTGATPEQQALAGLIRRAVSPVRTDRATTRPAPAPKVSHPAARHGRIKTTQYFEPATSARLEQAKTRLTTSDRRKDFGRLSKSRIVEAALCQALEEFERLGGDSRLCRDLETAKGA